jgi:hypothetical protein
MEPQMTQPQTSKKYRKLAVTLLTAPTALLVLPFLIYGATQPNTPAFLNVIIFLCVGIGFITWLPGLIIGIVLLTRKK